MGGPSLLLSTSQVSTKRECDRKYALEKIVGIRSPSTPAQALGVETDDTQLQPYLRDGRVFDYTRESGYIAAAGLAFLPQPKHPGLEVQKHFVMPSPSGLFSWQGYLDLWLPGGGIPDGDQASGPYIPVVGDFKTTKAWTWMKGPEQLAVDPQAQLYATWAMWKTGARVIDLHWIYFLTSGARKARRTFLRVYSDDVYLQFQGLEKTGLEIVELRKAAPPEALGKEALMAFALSLPPTRSSCGNFGGCPHQALCNFGPVAPADHIDSIFPKRSLPIVETNDLFANLGARKAAADEPPALGINPPIDPSLPPAEPVGLAKPKRTRGPNKPKAPVDGPALTEEMRANAGPACPPTAAEVAAQFPAPSGRVDLKRAAQSCAAISAIFQSLADNLNGEST